MTTMLYQGHGSYRFELNDGTIVYVDPFAGDGYDAPADLILVTHEHFDHNQIKKMPHAKGCKVVRAADVHPAPETYLSIESHGVRITAVQAYNKNHPVDACVGMVLDFDGISFYASGDTSTTDDMRSGKLAELALDYAAFPGDGFYNMDVPEAATCAKMVGARHSIPVHLVPVNDPNDASQLFSRKRAKKFNVPGRIILEPGETLELTSLAQSNSHRQQNGTALHAGKRTPCMQRSCSQEKPMFRKMRRFKQQLTDEEARAVLVRGKTGVMALLGDEGYPYAVPMNYVYADGTIYMHSALTGHKIDAITAHDKASFCVIDADDVVPSEYSTNFRSTIAFGRVRIVEDEAEKMRSVRLLGDKYNPNQEAALDAEVARSFSRMHMIAIDVEHLTGKQSKELAKVKGPLDE